MEICFFSGVIIFHLSFRLETAIPLLLREVALLSRENAVSIAFPDEGSFKRFHSMFTAFPTITCTKKRDGDMRIVKVKDGKLTLLGVDQGTYKGCVSQR